MSKYEEAEAKAKQRYKEYVEGPTSVSNFWTYESFLKDELVREFEALEAKLANYQSGYYGG